MLHNYAIANYKSNPKTFVEAGSCKLIVTLLSKGQVCPTSSELAGPIADKFESPHQLNSLSHLVKEYTPLDQPMMIRGMASFLENLLTGEFSILNLFWVPP